MKHEGTVQTPSKIQVIIRKENPGLELRLLDNPSIIRVIHGPVTIYGTIQEIRGLRWFIPDEWNAYGIRYETSTRSLLAAWDNDDIDAYEIDAKTGTAKELFYVG